MPDCDLGHFYSDAISAVAPSPAPTGPYQMNGYDQETFSCNGSGSYSGPAKKKPYAYVDYAETKPYWFMASHWGLADHFYPTEFGPSFTAHLNWIASTDEIAQGKALANFPSSWDSSLTDCETPASSDPFYWLLYNYAVHKKSGIPCFWQFHTMADLFPPPNGADNQPTWRYYAPTVKNEGGRIWSEFEAIEQVWCGTSGPVTVPCSGGPKTVNIVTPSKQILADVANGSLAGLTWVVPSWENSDHQGCNGKTSSEGGKCTGPAWVASIVNAIGESQFWDSTVIVVAWDDWGGWYDEDPPPMYVNDDRGRGIRTPVIVISPYNIQNSSYYYYGGHGWVSHDQYEPGSVLKFVEQVFNFPTLGSLPCIPYTYYYSAGCNLGYTDSTAQHSISDNMLDFSQTPKPFTPIPTPSGDGNSYFRAQTESLGPPDTE